jgi:hypothetical protein
MNLLKELHKKHPDGRTIYMPKDFDAYAHAFNEGIGFHHPAIGGPFYWDFTALGHYNEYQLKELFRLYICCDRLADPAKNPDWENYLKIVKYVNQ